MNEYFRSIILESTGATDLVEKETIQQLWSGYGKISRVELVEGPVESVVVKHVQLPVTAKHPRGWTTDIGHQRKVRSYQIESNWYKSYSRDCTARLPACYGLKTKNNEMLMVLEDLNAAGFHLRKHAISWEEISNCLAWLAQFHGSYMGRHPEGLWEVGTYWHLETRPEELAALTDQKLREAAPLIASQLNNCQYKTFVHGDAKLANFCFASDGRVAGVDYQYVGGGCGMKDVAYFIGSCLSDRDCEKMEGQILDTYFDHLETALGERNEALETEWRSLYRTAFADFHRFLKGWSPGHWKINSYSERVTAEVISKL